MDPVASVSTIREYSSRPLGAATLASLLRAGMAAPSAGDERPWHFVIIRDKALKGRIQHILPEAFMLVRAPVSILVCGDLTLQKHAGFWVLDCAAATQNILIAARRRKLGAIWLAVYPIEGRVQSIGALLEIPRHVVPFALVAVGHPEEPRVPENRLDPSRIQFNMWRPAAGEERGGDGRNEP